MVITDLPASSCVSSNLPAYERCVARLFLPPGGENAPLVIVAATADTHSENLSWLRAAYPGVRFAGASREFVLSDSRNGLVQPLPDDAVHALARATPTLSARQVVTPAQAGLIGAFLSTLALALATRPIAVYDVLAGIASIGFVSGTFFRALLAWIGGTDRETIVRIADDDRTLPVYTILVPLYREANVLPRLVQALRHLDYPADKLDIKLIVESDDNETAIVADALGSVAPFHVVRVPVGTPRTKPRACNYAFAFARAAHRDLRRGRPARARSVAQSDRAIPCGSARGGVPAGISISTTRMKTGSRAFLRSTMRCGSTF